MNVTAAAPPAQISQTMINTKISLLPIFPPSAETMNSTKTYALIAAMSGRPTQPAIFDISGKFQFQGRLVSRTTGVVTAAVTQKSLPNFGGFPKTSSLICSLC